MNNRHQRSGSAILFLTIMFSMLAFTLLAFRDGKFDALALVTGGILSVLFIIEYSMMTLIFKRCDRLLLVVVNLLLAIGVVTQYRMSADYAVKQLIVVAVGIACMISCTAIFKKPDFLRRMNPFIMLGSLLLMAALLFIGRENGGAKNWIMLGSASVQPSEFVKISSVFILAHYLDKRNSFKHLIVPIAFVAAVLGMLVLERDLGAALLIGGTALIVYYAATGNILTTALGIGAGCGGAVASYFLFDHVRMRIAAWQNPWASYESSGYQIAQGLMAIASGGLFGIGLGLGSPKSIPAYHTDYIFAVICEQFGIIVGICVIAFYLVIIIRGIIISLNAPNRFLTLLGFGCSTLIALQSFIIIAGVTKLIPLTGITLPFVSHGGSSIAAFMIMLGILQSIAVVGNEQKYGKELAEENTEESMEVSNENEA